MIIGILSGHLRSLRKSIEEMFDQGNLGASLLYNVVSWLMVDGVFLDLQVASALPQNGDEYGEQLGLMKITI